MDLKDRKKVGHLKPHKGHTTFEYNHATGKLNVAEIKTTDEGKKFIDVKEDCIYISALNRKNAFKKLKQHYGL